MNTWEKHLSMGISMGSKGTISRENMGKAGKIHENQFLNGYVNGKNNKALLESGPNPPALRFPIFWKVLEQQLNREDPESGRSSLEQLSCVLF